MPNPIGKWIAQMSPGGRFQRDVLWNAGSLVVLSVAGILVNSAIVELRGAPALGEFNQVSAIYLILSQFSIWGTQLAVLKEVSHNQKDRSHCAEYVAAALLLVTLTSLPMAGCVWLGSGWLAQVLGSPGVAEGAVVIAPGLVFFSWNKIYFSALNGMRSMRAYAVLQSLRYVTILAAILGMIVAGVRTSLLPLALSATEVFLFLVCAVWVHGWVIPLRLPAHPLGALKQQVSFGMRGFLSGIIPSINTRVDVLMLGYFSSDVTVGVYSYAAMLVEGLMQFPGIVRRNVNPLLGRAFSRSDLAVIEDMARRVKRVFFPLMAIAVAVLVAAYPTVVEILAPGLDLVPSWIAFGILSAGILLTAGYRPFSSIFLQAGRPGTQTILGAVRLLLNIVLNLLLIPLWGLYGAALATSASGVVMVLVLIVLARRILSVRL
jgi:O-antigen/teichoic acid export membrane protein